MAERVLATKVVNALVPTAQPNRVVVAAPGAEVLDAIAARYGGLWVGGRVTLTEEWFTFAPNGLNRALHDGVGAIPLPLRAVDRVVVEPGVLTKVIALHLGDAVLRVRCWGAPRFAETVRAAVAEARGRAGR